MYAHVCVCCAAGDAKGQAAVIREWEFEDGTKGGEGVEPGAAAGSAPPTAEELQAAGAECGLDVEHRKGSQALENVWPCTSLRKDSRQLMLV